MIMVSAQIIQHYAWIHKKPASGFFVLCAQNTTGFSLYWCSRVESNYILMRWLQSFSLNSPY